MHNHNSTLQICSIKLRMSTQMHILSKLEDGFLAQESELRLYHINKPITTP